MTILFLGQTFPGDQSKRRVSTPATPAEDGANQSITLRGPRGSPRTRHADHHGAERLTGHWVKGQTVQVHLCMIIM